MPIASTFRDSTNSPLSEWVSHVIGYVTPLTAALGESYVDVVMIYS